MLWMGAAGGPLQDQGPLPKVVLLEIGVPPNHRAQEKDGPKGLVKNEIPPLEHALCGCYSLLS